MGLDMLYTAHTETRGVNSLLGNPRVYLTQEDYVMRLGKRERIAKRERLIALVARQERIRAAGEPNGLRANGTGPGYRWPIHSKCRLNPQRRSLVTRKQGLLDSLANKKPTGARFVPKIGTVRTSLWKDANILLNDV